MQRLRPAASARAAPFPSLYRRGDHVVTGSSSLFAARDGLLRSPQNLLFATTRPSLASTVARPASTSSGIAALFARCVSGQINIEKIHF
jgi:hypothetical protein